MPVVVVTASAVVLLVWSTVVISYAAATHPSELESGPATMDLTDEPPAIVNLLVTRCRMNVNAADATLLDLAARRILDLHQPGTDPADLVVRVREPAPAGLVAYERRVFDRLAAVAGARFTPLQEVLGAYTEGGPGWYGDLRAEVIADAKERGLVRPRAAGTVLVLVSVLTGMGLAALWLGGLGVALAQHTPASDQRSPTSGVINLVGILGWFIASPVTALLLIVLTAPLLSALRPTAAGYDVGRHWLGVAAWLSAHPVNADLPPAAVAVWDRYLSYGVALGVNPLAARALDLRAGRVVVLTSHYTGRARTVQVRYRRTRLGYAQAGVQATAAGCVLAGCLAAWHFAVPATTPWPLPARFGAGLPLAAVTAWAGYTLIRALHAKLAPVTVAGQVLASHLWQPRQDKAVDWIELVVDDGRHNRTRPWLVRAERAAALSPGDHVQLRAQPFTRYVLSLTTTSPRAVPPSAPGPRA
jgi:hypothetical protein